MIRGDTAPDLLLYADLLSNGKFRAASLSGRLKFR